MPLLFLNLLACLRVGSVEARLQAFLKSGLFSANSLLFFMDVSPLNMLIDTPPEKSGGGGRTRHCALHQVRPHEPGKNRENPEAPGKRRARADEAHMFLYRLYSGVLLFEFTAFPVEPYEVAEIGCHHNVTVVIDDLSVSGVFVE